MEIEEGVKQTNESPKRDRRRTSVALSYREIHIFYSLALRRINA